MGNTLGKKTMEPLRQRLLVRRERLDPTHLREELRGIAESSQTTSDETENASLAESTEVYSVILENHEREAQEIADALERMQNGYYGRCVDCAGEISTARLEANPKAARCIDCQRRLEKEQNGVQHAVRNLLQREDWPQ